MANIRADTVRMEINFIPFPVGAGDKVVIEIAAEWRPEARPDVQPAYAYRALKQEQGDPLVPDLLDIQTAAQNLIATRFGSAGQNLTTNRLQRLAIDLSSIERLVGTWSRQIRITGSWYPDSTQNISRLQSTSTIETLQSTSNVAPAFSRIFDVVLAAFGAVATDLGHTLLIGGFGAATGSPPPNVSAILGGADVRDFFGT